MSTNDKDARPASGEISPEDRAAIKRRAGELGRRLEQARGTEPAVPARASSRSNGAAMGSAFRISTEMVGGLVVGSAIGWALDRWLGTWPGMFIVFFLLGAAAGMVNVIRAGLKMKTGPSDPSKGPSVRDDDED